MGPTCVAIPDRTLHLKRIISKRKSAIRRQCGRALPFAEDHRVSTHKKRVNAQGGLALRLTFEPSAAVFELNPSRLCPATAVRKRL